MGIDHPQRVAAVASGFHAIAARRASVTWAWISAAVTSAPSWSRQAAAWLGPVRTSGGIPSRAGGHHVRAAGGERAAPRRLAFGPRGRLVQVPRLVGVGRRHRVDQRAGIGMTRRVDHRLRVPRFHDPPAVEDHHGLGHLIGGGQVVGDVDERDALVAVEPVERFQDRGTQRGVDHRDRLVGQDDRRPDGQRPCDHDALALAAGQFVGMLAQGLARAQAHRLKRGLDHGIGLAIRTGQAEGLERLQ